MNYEITCTEENNYIIRVFHGTLSISDIFSSWEYLIEEKLKRNNYIGVINDFSDSKLNMSTNDIEQLMKLLKNNFKIFVKLKLAVITTSPGNIIFPLLAQRNSPFNIQAFSTVSAAKKWMLQDSLN